MADVGKDFADQHFCLLHHSYILRLTYNGAELKALLRVSLESDHFEEGALANMECSHLAMLAHHIGLLAKGEQVLYVLVVRY